MSDATVIKSFLVSLGFQVEDSQLKKFQAGIVTATESVVGLAAAVESAAVAVAVFATKLAGQLDALYFASQRTNASATNLEALNRAAQNLGAGAGEAQQSVESLARFMRNNPGGEGFLHSLGVQTRAANGGLRDTAQMLVDLGKKLKDQPFYLANQYAGMFGISERMLLAMRNGEFAQRLEEQQRLLKDSGFEEATRSAHEYATSIRNLGTRFDAIKARIGNGVFKILQPELDAFGKWFDDHSDDISKFIATFVKGVVTASGIILPIIKTIGDGWSMIFDVFKDFGEWINSKFSTGVGDTIGSGVGWLFDKLGIRAQVDALQGGAAQNDPNAPRGVRNNNPGNLEFAGQAGATREAGSGRFARFGTPQAGLDALARQIELYGGRGYNSVRAIISKFAPPGENDTEGYIRSVASRIGVGETEALKLGNRLQLAQLMQAIIEHENGVKNPYSREMVASAAASGIASTKTIHAPQTTTIHVQGGDAKAIAREVERSQRSVQADHVRNLQATVK